jgi:metallopeptidase MepB
MHLPGVAIVAQFIKPTSRYPSIFNHEGLSTFAHELAHAIHKLLQGVNKPFIPGPRDFVEIPSITAEKWMSNPEVLQQISCHYTYLKPEYLTAWKDIFSPKIPPPQPPRQAPLEMFNEIHYEMHPRNDLYNTMQLLWKAKFDFIIHSSSEKDLRTMDFGVVCKQIVDEQTGIFTPSDGKGEIRNNSYLYWGLLNNYDTSIYCYLL